MIEDYIPVNSIVSKDPARQGAIAQAFVNKSMFIAFIPITGVPKEVALNAEKAGMVRALIGEKLFQIVGDGKGLNAPNKVMWANLLGLAQKTALNLAKNKNAAPLTAALKKLKN